MSIICNSLEKYNYREGINPYIDAVVHLINERFANYFIDKLFLSESVVFPYTTMFVELSKAEGKIKRIVSVNSNWSEAAIYEYLMDENNCGSSKKSDVLISSSSIPIHQFRKE